MSGLPTHIFGKDNVMKILSLTLLLMASMAFVLLGCSDNSAPLVSPTDQSAQTAAPLEKSNKVDFTFTDRNIGFDHNPQMWVAGRTMHMKNVQAFEDVQANDTRVTGEMEHYLSVSFNVVTGEGPCHGSWTLRPYDKTVGGVWEGTYEGYRSKTNDPSGFIFALPLKVVGHGRGGSIDGMQAKMTITLTVLTNANYYPLPIYWSGTDGTGYIK
jgi:hypothetical protein